MRAQDLITIQKIARHRNGISGVPFHVVTFRYADPDAGRDRNMVATFFDVDADTTRVNPRCAVLDVDEVVKGEIYAWRGDYFAPVLKEAIHRRERKELPDAPA